MRLKKLFALMLGVLLLFSACTTRASENQSSYGSADVITGRYVEQATNFPNFNEIAAYSEVAPDTYFVLGTRSGVNEVWNSVDGGYTWSQKEYSGLAELNVISGVFDIDGSAHITHALEDDGVEFIVTAAVARPDGVSDLGEMPGMEDYNYGMMWLSDGSLLINNMNNLAQINLSSQKVEETYYPEGSIWPGTFIECDGMLAVSTSDSILIYDIATGQQSESIKYAASTDKYRPIAIQADSSGFYYCDNSGLYRIAKDGSMTEQLIDGSLTSFGAPSLNIERLCVTQDNAFVLLCKNGGSYQIQRYVYDANMEREPNTELHVYSLYADAYIQQAIGLFQRDNPNVKITYHIGIAGDTAITATDALRTLSTELVAGKGPDILILDGMPVESYIKHGALSDLSDAVVGEIGNLYPSLSGMYHQSNGLYAVPARFSAQIIVGVDIENIRTLPDLYSWLQSQQEQRIGIRPDIIMEQLYPFCAARWFDESGMLNQPVMREDLESLKLLSDMAEANQSNHAVHGLFTQAQYWNGSGIALMNGTLDDLDLVADVYSAINERGEGTVKLFPDIDGGSLSPSSILGVNASSSHIDIAKDFVRFALSDEPQSSPVSNGRLPANKEALRSLAYSHPAGELMRSGGTENNATGEVFELDAYWPEDTQIADILTLIERANGAIYYNETVYHIVLEETADLFVGSRSVDETVNTLVQKVDRYLQEIQ